MAASPSAAGSAAASTGSCSIAASTSAIAARWRARALRLPSSRSTCASMSTARRVIVTRLDQASATSLGSARLSGAPAPIRSAACARFSSCRAASVLACPTSMSISASSRSSVARSAWSRTPRAAPGASGDVPGVVIWL